MQTLKDNNIYLQNVTVRGYRNILVSVQMGS